MSSPKEKAKELVDKYYHLFSVELENSIDYREAKQCALIAVDLSIEYNDFHIEFLQEVKQEIENL
jgi:hypothetical protein